MRFVKKWKKYVLEVTRDVTQRFGVGIVGKGTRVLSDRTVKIPKDSIILYIESKVIKTEGKPLKFKMIFKSEEDAFQYLSFKKGGSKQDFYPDRDGEFVDEEAKKPNLPVHK